MSSLKHENRKSRANTNDIDVPFIPFSSAKVKKWRACNDNDDIKPNVSSEIPCHVRDDNHLNTAINSNSKQKSYGLNAKQFHLSSSCLLREKDSNQNTNSMNNQKKIDKQTKQLLSGTRIRVDYNDLKMKYSAFVKITDFKYYPIQETAFIHLDELHKDESKTKSQCTGNYNDGQDITDINDAIIQQKNKRQRLDSIQSHATESVNDVTFTCHSNFKRSHSPLWSLEPRIFAIETSSTGKRKYLVCHLGRFMHHYWRFCESYAKHHYELIREGTPCRLYFGENKKRYYYFIRYLHFAIIF